jgi:hypothetical protein
MTRIITLVIGLLTCIAVRDAVGRPPDKRFGAGTREVVEIGGMEPIHAVSVTGGTLVGEVIVQRSGSDAAPKKHVAAVHVEPITIEAGAMELMDLMRRATDQGAPQKLSGRVLTVGQDGKVSSIREFTDAVITEVRLPAFDASSKDAARCTVTLAPASVKFKAGTSEAAPSGGAAKSKSATVGNFRVTVPGVDTSGAMKIDPIVLSRKTSTQAAGDAKVASIESGPLNFPNLVVVLAQSQAQSAMQWQEQFLVKGPRGDADEKIVTIELLAPDLKSSVLALEARGVGLVSVRNLPSEPGSDSVGRIAMEMYVETCSIKPPSK